MALTVTLQNASRDVRGTHRRSVVSIAFDTSYPDGGESLTPRQLDLTTVEQVNDVLHQGLLFKYDRTNSKLQAFKPGGPVLIDEVTGTFTAGVAYTLKHQPAYILAIRGTAGSTGAKRVIPVGETAGAGDVAVNFTTGVLTWGDAGITAARIVYIPRGVPGFTTADLVIDELVTLATGAGNLASRAAAIQYVWNDEDNSKLTYVPVGETPSGQQCAIDLINGANTTITVETATIGDGAAKLKVTYLKYTAAIHDQMLRLIDQTDWLVSSNAVGPGTDQAWDVPGLVIPCFGQQIVGETGAGANLFSTMVDAGGAVAANVAVYNPWRNVISFLAGDAYATVEIPILYLVQETIGNQLVEISDATDLSWVTGLRLEAVGW